MSSHKPKPYAQPKREGRTSTWTNSGTTTPRGTSSAGKGGGTRTTSGSSSAAAQAEIPKRIDNSSSTMNKIWAFIGYATDNNDYETRPQDNIKSEDECKILKKQLNKALMENEDIEKRNTTVRTTLEKQCEEWKDQLVRVQQAVQEKDAVIHRKEREHTKLQNMYEEKNNQLDKAKQESQNKDANIKWFITLCTTLEKERDELKNQMAGVKQTVKEKDAAIQRKMQDYSKLEKQLIEMKNQLDKAKQESQAKDDIIKRKPQDHTKLEDECKELKKQLKKALMNKEDIEKRNMPVRSKLEKQCKELKDQLVAVQQAVQEKDAVIQRFGIDASKRLKATGQATNINDDDPCEKITEILEDLWENYYRPACQVMESTAQQKMDIIRQEISSILNAEDYLDVIMTNALQKAFNYSVDFIKNYLRRALEEELHCQSAKSHRFISMLPKKQRLTEAIKLIDLHYNDTLDSSDKQKKSEPIYREFMVFVYDTIQFTDPASLQEGAENMFLTTVNEGMRMLSMEFTTAKYTLFSQAATITSEIVWQMIKLPSPILLKSHGIKVSQQMQLPFDAKEMRVHAASTKKSTRVAAFAEPIVISSKTGGAITHGSVFCK